MPNTPRGSRLRDSLERNKFLWEIAKGVTLGIAAVFSFQANSNSEMAKNELERARSALEERSQQSQFDIKAYELVEKALSSDPAVRQVQGMAAAAIVNALTRSPLRDELQNALRAGLTDKELLRKLDDATQFDSESYTADAPTSGQTSRAEPSWRDDMFAWSGRAFAPVALAQSSVLSGYRVDIFYCESVSTSATGARKARADLAAAKLKNSGVTVTVRTRLLPSLVQARPGYQSFADEVRYSEGASERQAASELARILAIKPESLKRVQTKTPRYLSAFYCQ